MKRVFYLVCIFSLAITAQISWAWQAKGVLSQISTSTALKAGNYDGITTFAELKKHGDTGLGTFDGLDGEMIAVAGEFFRVSADGKVFPVKDSQSTPYAMIVPFRAERQIALKNIPTSTELQQALDRQLAGLDKVYAIKVEGTFKHLRVRSIGRQEKPYPILEQALKDETVFDFHDIEGTLVGFRFPDYMNGVNFPGYHFHFISKDRKVGGHLLDCALDEIDGEIAAVFAIDLKLPQ